MIAQFFRQLNIKETGLLERQQVRCLSVIYDEGLRSYKAIAFIQSKCSQNRISNRTINYLLLGAPLQKNVLLKQQKTLRCFSKNLGEKLWIK